MVNNMVNKKDLILIGIVVLIATLSLAVMHVMNAGGTKVVITQDGKEYGTYDLDQDDIIYLEAEGGTNTVKIENGVVSMTEASCPDQICVHTYPISKEEPGSIVC